MNVMLLLFKFIAGIIGNSSAMIADAVHSLSDFITDMIIIVFVRIANKPSDQTHDYGHAKFETFATLLIGFILLLVGLGIAWAGASDIISVIRGATLESPGMLALTAAILSIIAKESLYHYTVIKGRMLKSEALIANGWHHRSDGLSSIATAVGIGGAIFLGEKWTILDPMAALFVSFFIVIMAFKLMKPCIEELMERSLPEEMKKEITAMVESFEGVSHLHNLRTRKIGNKCAIEFHIRMNGETSLAKTHDTVTKIECRLRDHYGQGTHVMVHTEPLP